MERHAPATLRNRGPIADVLANEIPSSGRVVEIASGTGEHAVYFARLFPQIDWQPTDADPDALASIGARVEKAHLRNLFLPIWLDAAHPDWPIDAADAILCVNMVHISPWSATIGLFEGAGLLLRDDAALILYGPFLEEDVGTSPSNLEFDASLRSRDSQWGLRNLADIDDLASAGGFVRTARHEMPANNLCIVYRRNRPALER